MLRTQSWWYLPELLSQKRFPTISTYKLCCFLAQPPDDPLRHAITALSTDECSGYTGLRTFSF